MGTKRVGNTIECVSTHLTSFAVLVDVQGNTRTTTTSIGKVIVQ